MALSFNSAAANGLVALVPSNGSMGGRLHSVGNVCNMALGEVETKDVSSTGPGTDYELRRVSGTRGRSATWDWVIVTPDAAKMSEVEVIVSQYILDGRAYVLEDAWGRTSAYGVLMRRRDVERRRVSLSGRYRARWTLEFRVLRSMPTTAGKL